ncbi:MAG TPA: helix-turn-helix domain-containing protein [Burkholderiaceae bacterium]|nr:helix-turn-helix domain-containing protein [Burkholderiaceae bacterium]
MRKRSAFPFEVSESAVKLGENLRVARVRRSMTQDDLALRCNITRKTLSEIEKGQPGVTYGNVLTVLWTLGLLEGVKKVADPDADEHGRILDAARQPKRIRNSSASAIDNDF